jgi:hypothetical protein
VKTFQKHLQTLEFEDLGEQKKLTQTVRATWGFARIDALLEKIAA